MTKILNNTNLDLIIDFSLLRKSKKELITAPIFFDLDNFQFPENNWSDFAVVIMGWWLTAYSKLLRSCEKKVDLLFMDGPMVINITAIDFNLIKISCMNQSNTNDFIEVKCIAKKQDFGLILKNSAQKLVDSCLQRGWDSIDIKNLICELKEFKRNLDDI